jgi:hypothetical protein
MFLVNDPYGNKIFEFRGGRIFDRTGKTLGLVRKGVVCDKNGTPTRCSVVGHNIEFPSPQTGKESVCLTVDDCNIMDSGVVGAVVVNTKKHANIMLGAAAYWEFVWSLT